jgi:hypothetical protein
LGIEATAAAKAVLAKRLRELVPFPNAEAEISILHPLANVWVRETDWMSKLGDQLLVPRWTTEQCTDSTCETKLRAWAKKMPEIRDIEVKGAWLLNGEALEVSAKPHRSYELRYFGYS